MKIRQKLCVFNSRLRKRYRVINLDDYPETVDDKVIYVIGDLQKPQYAIFLCPCGCGQIIELNANPESRPCWKIQWHLAGTLSFSPSINRKVGCGSHFHLKNSKVLWCH